MKVNWDKVVVVGAVVAANAIGVLTAHHIVTSADAEYYYGMIGAAVMFYHVPPGKVTAVLNRRNGPAPSTNAAGADTSVPEQGTGNAVDSLGSITLPVSDGTP